MSAISATAVFGRRSPAFSGVTDDYKQKGRRRRRRSDHKMYFIYARQSVERKDSASIQTQVDQCLRFVSGGYKVFQDVGYSGGNTRRPQFEQMVKAVQSGAVEAVVSYRLDRISRNISDFANLMQLFEKHGVKYISATENLDTSTPVGRAMMYIASVFAQLERETIAERILDNYKFRAKQGFFMGGNTPFGYEAIRVDAGGKMMPVLVPGERADDLRMIFDRFTSGQSLAGIAKDLNRREIYTAKGNPWTSNAVKRVLCNMTPCCADEKIYAYLVKKGYQVPNPIEHYSGEHGMCLFFKNANRNRATDVSDQIAVVGTHDPLIPSDRYIMAQRILERNKESSPGKRSSRTFLAGIVKCGVCGHSVGIKYTHRTTSAGKAIYAYYYCRSRHSRGLCDNKTYLPADELEMEVIRSCRQHIADMVSRSATTEQNAPKDARDTARIQAQIDNLINNIGNGNAVVDRLLTQRITKLQEELDKMAAETADPTPEIDIEWIQDRFQHFEEMDIQEQASCIRQAVNQITIDALGNINIEFSF